ncbi:MAG: preprotein translocase subunit YajC [Saccharofermentanales bacterium]
MFQFFALSSTAATSGSTPAPSGLSSLLQLVVPLGLMFVLMYFLMIRPQKKKEKALRELIDSMTVGDKCLTSGGIVGRVVNIKDDEVTIQTSVANTLLTLRKSAISSVSKPLSSDD